MATVLVIDDIDDTRDAIREMLERGGYEVLEASNGKEGMTMIEQHDPDAVVTDILMPEMEGIETIRSIIRTNPELPVIAITASMDTPYLEVDLKVGAVGGLSSNLSNRPNYYVLYRMH
ncbi:MAG: response regulator [bacterium]